MIKIYCQSGLINKIPHRGQLYTYANMKGLFSYQKIEPEVKPVLFDCILFINTMFPVAVFIYGCLVSIMLTEGPFGTVVKSINFGIKET